MAGPGLEKLKMPGPGSEFFIAGTGPGSKFVYCRGRGRAGIKKFLLPGPGLGRDWNCFLSPGPGRDSNFFYCRGRDFFIAGAGPELIFLLPGPGLGRNKKF